MDGKRIRAEHHFGSVPVQMGIEPDVGPCREGQVEQGGVVVVSLRDTKLAAFHASVFPAADRRLEPKAFFRKIIGDKADGAAPEMGVQPQFPFQGGIDGIRTGEIPLHTFPDVDGRHFDRAQDSLDLLIGQIQDVRIMGVGQSGHPRLGLEEDDGGYGRHHQDPQQENPTRQPVGEGVHAFFHASRCDYSMNFFPEPHAWPTTSPRAR